MNSDELRALFDHQPFQPLRIRMVSGTTADIRTPERMVGPRHIAFLNRKGVIEVIATEFIESIDPLPRRKGNGQGRRRRAER